MKTEDFPFMEKIWILPPPPPPPGQNGRHSADDIFRCISVNEKFRILIKMSLKFVPKDLAPNRRQAII